MDTFEAISNDIRRRILKTLVTPKSFSQLVEELNIESAALAFHLKKLEGLITKDSQGNYMLKEEGKRVLAIINSIEGQYNNFNIPYTTNNNPPPLIIQYADNITVTENMIIKLRNEGRKLVIKDVDTVEFKHIEPKLLSEVLELIENVNVIKCTEDLFEIVSYKSKNVGSISTNDENERKSFVDSLISLFLPKRQLKIVYNGPLQYSGNLRIHLDGGVVKIRRGDPHLLAKCIDLEDLEIQKDSINADGCYLKITYPDLNSLEISLDGGTVDVSDLKINNLSIEVDGGVVDINVVSENEVRLSLNGGKMGGKIVFIPNTNPNLSIQIDGGISNMSITIPEDMTVITNSNINGGVVTLPKSRIGKNGVLKIIASVNGGVITVNEDIHDEKKIK
ncbi:MAG: winged helix-turn-helix domain-containing protein [Saccharolobus sp.]|uniref:winged helix-turn-helix domain-containing protein n=2 Tax=Sulfolobaceae TaxID=118883 RepID=UPI001F0F868E|nr:winged helix-turn-helix domain-containing protein [Saccharolobus shibatae]MCH4816403.1 winged helix-turn-helix domain-containing protein [Saccharolobus shibatae]